jgi:hypothetical protein
MSRFRVLWWTWSLAACGARSELLAPRADATPEVAPPSVAVDGSAPACPTDEVLAGGSVTTISICHLPAAERARRCARGADGRTACPCPTQTPEADSVCGFATVGFVDRPGGRGAVRTARCSLRTGQCDCVIDGVACTCQSEDPRADCSEDGAPRRNCCWRP